jgi:hypothetical protein
MKKLFALLLFLPSAAFADMNHSISSSVKFESLSAASTEAFSFTTSFLEGDATPGSAVTVGTVPNFSDLTSTSAGSVGTAAVAIDNHTITLTPGTGTGIVMTGQFVVDLTIE